MSRAGGLALLGLGAAVLAASAALPALRGLARPAGDVPTTPVVRGPFERRIHAEGNLKAAEATILGAPPEIRRPLKLAWLAGEGSAVRAGDIVIRFDPTDLEEELREGRHEAATADSRITSKTVREEGNRRNLDRDAEVASLELEYAQSFQNKDEQIFSRQEIIESQIDQTLALEKRDHAQRTGAVQQGLARTELDLLAIERRKAELQISQATEALQGLEVRAPHDGIFVLKSQWGRKPEVGQMVWGGNAVAEIPKPQKMEAEVYVLEADAGGLAVGLPATVVLDAHPGATYSARVRQVAVLAQPRTQQAPIQYFNVILELERTDPAVMKPGQRMQAVLSLDERRDVLTVPRQAVFERDGRKIVYVRHGADFQPATVELGPAALGRVVIESGLSGGEQIALRDPTRPAAEPVLEGGGEPAATG